MTKDEKLVLLTLQGRGDPVKKGLAFLPAKEQELFILPGSQLVQLGKEGYCGLIHPAFKTIGKTFPVP